MFQEIHEGLKGACEQNQFAEGKNLTERRSIIASFGCDWTGSYNKRQRCIITTYASEVAAISDCFAADKNNQINKEITAGFQRIAAIRFFGNRVLPDT